MGPRKDLKLIVKVAVGFESFDWWGLVGHETGRMGQRAVKLAAARIAVSFLWLKESGGGCWGTRTCLRGVFFPLCMFMSSSSTIYWKDCPFSKDELTIFVWVFYWALYSVPLTYLFIVLLSKSQSWRVVCFLTFFFSIVLASLGLLSFCIYFNTSLLSISTK